MTVHESVLEQDLLEPLFSAVCSSTDVRRVEQSRWDADMWSAVANTGVPWIGIPEENGGSGGTLMDVYAVLAAAGRHAVPLPLMETSLLAGWIVSAGDRVISGSPATVAPPSRASTVELKRAGKYWQVNGVLKRIPWGDIAEEVLLLAELGGRSFVLRLPHDRLLLTTGSNLAGEPRDDARLVDVRLGDEQVLEAPYGVTTGALELRGALGRSAQLVGAMQRALDITIRYANERRQFGRTIGSFQAIQNLIVLAAEELNIAAQATLAAFATVAAVTDSLDARFEVAAAKATTSEAAGRICSTVHQVHGAIGMTLEHELNLFTRRLWAWRDEYRSEHYWSQVASGCLTSKEAPRQTPWLRMTAQPAAPAPPPEPGAR